MHRVQAFLLTLLTLSTSAPWASANPHSGTASLSADALGVVRAGDTEGKYDIADGVTLNFSQRSSARVFAKAQGLPLRPGPLTKTWTVILMSGHVQVVIANGERRAVMIQDGERRGAIVFSGALEMGVLGSKTMVANVDAEATAINQGRLSEFPPETQIEYAALESAPARKALETPGSLHAQKRLFFAPTGEASVTGLHPAPVQDAVSYQLTVKRDGETVRRLATRDTNLGFAFTLPTGSYRASVRSINAFGVPSKPSPEVPLRVVGVSLPPDAQVDAKGRIHIAEEQKVHFINADGLLMAHTGGKRSRSAAEPLGLSSGERTAAAIFDPQSYETVVALLLPREFSAEVHVGPKLATWPLDPLRITIALRGDFGALSLESVVPKVTLGIRPISVEFHQEGDMLVGTVMPEPLTSPDVLRVEVMDPNGKMLGRDFVELIRSQPSSAPFSHGSSPQVSLSSFK